MAELGDVFDDEDIDLLPVDDTVPEITPTIVDNIFDTDPDHRIPTDNNDILNDLLKIRGIEDGKIKIIGEDNQEEEINFHDLTKEEQLEILNYQDQVENHDLDNSEIDLLNSIRSSGKTVEQFLEDYKQEIINSLGTQEQGVNYEIDAYDDQELYMLDLKNKFDLTDEELVKELEKELQDPDLFKRKTDKLRSEYKQLEDQYNEAQKQEFESKQQEQYNSFVTQMSDTASKSKHFHGIDVEDNETQEVLSHLLQLDQNGTSEFYKGLNNPEKLYELAWYSKYGKEAFEAITNAYEQEISRLKAEIKPNNKVKPNPVIIDRKNNNTELNIFDLD